MGKKKNILATKTGFCWKINTRLLKNDGIKIIIVGGMILGAGFHGLKGKVYKFNLGPGAHGET
ncbi:hypothetical protein [Bartonella grahamii]|uniref:hypothetical protein n=1 Tax=Bartonella grahamii TaxID=33045 RepID=UPI001ABAF492|nr:hypothetical protein [Bartonella grahamii]